MPLCRLCVPPAHIKRFEGEIESPFAAQQHDTQGLTGLVSFSEFDMSALGGASAGTAAAHKSRRHSHKKDRKGDKRVRDHGKKHRRSRGDDSHRSSKKHKGSSGSASAPADAQVLIGRYVGKVVQSCKASVSASALAANPKLLKAAHRKGAAKVFEDWSSKPRGDLPMHEWLNDKRKAKIRELVDRYLQLSENSAPTLSTARSSAVSQRRVVAPRLHFDFVFFFLSLLLSLFCLLSYSQAATGRGRPSASDSASQRAPADSRSSAAAAAAAPAVAASASGPSSVAPSSHSGYVPLPGDPRSAHRQQMQAPLHSHSHSHSHSSLPEHRYAPVPTAPQPQPPHRPSAAAAPAPRFYPSSGQR